MATFYSYENAPFIGNTTNVKDANFRASVIDFEEALAALGWVKVTCTGQFDTAAGVVPATGATTTHWSVWRADDALQATHPLFVKFYWQYSVGSANVFNFAVSAALGTAVNTGTGALESMANTNTSVTSALNATSVVNSAAGTSWNYFVGDSGNLNMALNVYHASSNNNGAVMSIGRARDWEGNSTQYGAYITSAYMFNNSSISNSHKCILHHNIVAQPTATSNMMALGTGGNDRGMGSTSNSGLIGNTSYGIPFLTGGDRSFIGGPNPHLIGIGYGDVAQGSTFTMTHLGVSRTFIVATKETNIEGSAYCHVCLEIDA